MPPNTTAATKATKATKAKPTAPAAATKNTPAGATKRSQPNLPNEILLEIVSDFTLAKYNMMRQSGQEGPPDGYQDDLNALRTLSQLSFVFRQLCLPLLWERLEVCCVPDSGGKVWHNQLSHKLERVSEGLVKTSPHLLPLIRSVAVTMTRVRPTEVLPPFSLLLSKCPNLESIEIPHAHSAITSFIEKNMTHQLPQLKSFGGPSCMHNLLKVAPNIETVLCTEEDGNKLLGSMAKGNKKAVKLIGFSLGSKDKLGLAKRIVGACPLLEELWLTAFPCPECSAVLSKLKHLRLVRVDFGRDTPLFADDKGGYLKPENWGQDPVIKRAEDMLVAVAEQKGAPKGLRRIEIWTRSSRQAEKKLAWECSVET